MARAYRGDTVRAMVSQRILTLALGYAAAWPVGSSGPVAVASPRSDPTSGRAVFTGAATPHATSIVLDPAALGVGQRDEIYVALTGVLDRLRIDLSGVDDGDLQAPAGRVSDLELSPGAMVALTYHFAGNLTLGLEAHSNPAEVFPAGREELRYHALGGRERSWTASVGGSIRVTNDLLFGAGVSHQNTFLRLRYARDTALEQGRAAGGLTSSCGGEPCGLGNPLATERYDVDVRSTGALGFLSTSNLRVNVGVMYQVAREVWLAVAYHTPPGFAVQTELAGRVDVTRAPRDVTAGSDEVVTGDAVVELQLPASVDVELRARLPADLELHVGGRWEDLSRLTGYDVRAYGRALSASRIPEWTVRPLGLQDTIAAWAGAEQVDRGEWLRLGARGGFETAAVSAARTSPLTIAQRSFTLDVGAQLRWTRLTNRLVAQISYGVQYFPTLTGAGTAFDPRDRVTCVDSGFDYATAACEAVRGGYAQASAAGSYERFEHALRIGLRYELR
jgi:long-subunit fatty acid transport protein